MYMVCIGLRNPAALCMGALLHVYAAVPLQV